jgi:ferredoxin
MRVVVDYALCESNAVCMRLVPEVFEVRDDDRLYLRAERPPETMRVRLDEAVRRCPKQALSLIDD